MYAAAYGVFVCFIISDYKCVSPNSCAFIVFLPSFNDTLSRLVVFFLGGFMGKFVHFLTVELPLSAWRKVERTSWWKSEGKVQRERNQQWQQDHCYFPPTTFFIFFIMYFSRLERKGDDVIKSHPSKNRHDITLNAPFISDTLEIV